MTNVLAFFSLSWALALLFTSNAKDPAFWRNLRTGFRLSTFYFSCIVQGDCPLGRGPGLVLLGLSGVQGTAQDGSEPEFFKSRAGYFRCFCSGSPWG